MIVEKFKDHSDGSIKTVFIKKNKEVIEMSTLFNRPDRDVICVPTHHFCSLGCKMCHLTNNKLNKKMAAICYDDFKIALYDSLKNFKNERYTNKRKLLISFMGVGEPLLNQNLILQTFEDLDCIKDELGYENISFAIATCMPSKELFLMLQNEILSKEIPIKIHFSLHTPVDEKRFDLLPSSKVTVNEALSLLSEYKEKFLENKNLCEKFLLTHKSLDPVEIHYTLIDKVNDTDNELNLMIKYLSLNKIPIKFISFNPTQDLKRSNRESIWVLTIKEKAPFIKIKNYTPPGKEIGSSCGEFTKHYYHEEIETDEQKKEFEKWKKTHQILD